MHVERSDERDASFIQEGFAEDNMWGHEWQNNGSRIRMGDKVRSRRFKQLFVIFYYCKLLFPMQMKTVRRMAVASLILINCEHCIFTYKACRTSFIIF